MVGRGRIAPDRTAPDRTAPDRTAPDRTAPDRTARDRIAAPDYTGRRTISRARPEIHYLTATGTASHPGPCRQGEASGGAANSGGTRIM